MWCVVLGEMSVKGFGFGFGLGECGRWGHGKAFWVWSRCRAVHGWAVGWAGEEGEEGVWDLGDRAVGEVRAV